MLTASQKVEIMKFQSEKCVIFISFFDKFSVSIFFFHAFISEMKEIIEIEVKTIERNFHFELYSLVSY